MNSHRALSKRQMDNKAVTSTLVDVSGAGGRGMSYLWPQGLDYLMGGNQHLPEGPADPREPEGNVTGVEGRLDPNTSGIDIPTAGNGAGGTFYGFGLT